MSLTGQVPSIELQESEGVSNSEYLRENVEPVLCQIFTQVLQHKPPDPVPMIIEILNEMAKKQGKESAEKENEKSELREEKYKLLNEIAMLEQQIAAGLK